MTISISSDTYIFRQKMGGKNRIPGLLAYKDYKIARMNLYGATSLAELVEYTAKNAKHFFEADGMIIMVDMRLYGNWSDRTNGFGVVGGEARINGLPNFTQAHEHVATELITAERWIQRIWYPNLPVEEDDTFGLYINIGNGHASNSEAKVIGQIAWVEK